MSLDDMFSSEMTKSKNVLCRHDPTVICQIDGIRFFGASESRITNTNLARVKADLLINLTGHPLDNAKDLIVQAGEHWAPLRDLCRRVAVEEICIDWPDMGVIPVGRNFWTELFTLIKKANKQNVVVFCVGGHGRTGTCVASLMTVMLGIHGGRAITNIRQDYCKKAIETKRQEDFVRALTAPLQKGGSAKSNK